jgi:hypothetical protein
MKRYLKHQAKLVIMLVVIQTFFAACTQEDEFATASGDELQLNVTTAGYASIEPGAPETRATDAGYATTFAANDEIGIIVVQGGNVVQNNIPYKLSGSTWVPSGASKATIPQGTGVTWLVYYPYSNTMDGKKTVEEIFGAFEVPVDQGTQAKYTKADLMICTGSLSNNTLTATLTHRLAMLEINLPTGAGNAKLAVGGGTVTPWNISGTTFRYLVKPATGVTISGSHAYSATAIINWQQTNVTLAVGKYTKVNVTDPPLTSLTIDGYTGAVKVNYTNGSSDNITGGGDMQLPTGLGKTIKSIVVNGKEHQIGRVVAFAPVKLKLDASGNLQFRTAVGGYIPIGSYAEFQEIYGLNVRDGKYRQEADLDLMDVEWRPIAVKEQNNFNNVYDFYGEFDGAGKKISNLKISNGNDKGLFRGNQGIIRNVHIASGTITTGSFSGSICGVNKSSGQIISCSNAATVLGNGDYVGGVVGSNSGAVTACYNTGAVTGANNVGGVAGWNGNTVTACYNTGKVTGTGDYIGGVSGNNNGTVTACYWKSGTAPNNNIGSEFSNFFTPSGSAAWNTGTGGTNGWWKAGTVGGDQLPKLWYE